MKVIVPLAGKGTRLLPLTQRVPKPLVHVAGRPVMDYVMDMVAGLDVEELIVITGHLKEAVQRYIGDHYRIPARYVEQRTLDGTAGAINLARPWVDGPVMIIFVDTLFDADLSIIPSTTAAGIMWVKEVEDYQRFGVVVTDAAGYMTRIVEKPKTPVSKLANIGLYYVKDWRTLFEGIAHVLEQPPGQGGEFYLTDAFQYMIDHGRRILTAQVAGWYDCGKVDTLLDTNRHLLEHGRALAPPVAPGVVIRPPVRIEAGTTLRDVTIGPNVTIEGNGVIEGSTIENSVVGSGARITRSRISGCVIGDDQVIADQTLANSVLDAGQVQVAK
ncbi:MAG TPA: sugar phosphate nucleotidyltransferase [Gemmatimonadales bacterium]|nr:sugar phosphate nucleotidyltransferase [Gemmatimonadales bacterium]